MKNEKYKNDQLEKEYEYENENCILVINMRHKN